MNKRYSIAIETSCRAGGVALGADGELAKVVEFDASTRHAAVLLSQLDGLLGEAGLRAGDLAELYVSAGPGSFTGLRIGITAARVLAQQLPRLRCVAVPSAWAVARNALGLSWRHLGVVMDAGDGRVYAWLFVRGDGGVVPAGEPAVVSPREFLSAAPRPLLLIGEGLARHDLSAPRVSRPPSDKPSLHLPTAEGVWRVGRALAAAGRFTDYHHLLPIYTRKPQAVRLWERRRGRGE